MAESFITIDASAVSAKLGEVIRGIESIPEAGNPLSLWAAAYKLREVQAWSKEAPPVSSSGSFRGNPWPANKPQYTRKTDGVTVPVWGDVPRAVLQGGRFGAEGPHSRLGVVTRSSAASLRRASGLTGPQKAAGFGKVEKGQRFSEANVKGKLRSNGTRYARGDKQLSQGGTNSSEVFRAWYTAPQVLSDKGREVTLTINMPLASRMNELRPFVTGPQIEREEREHLLSRFVDYVRRLSR